MKFFYGFLIIMFLTSCRGNANNQIEKTNNIESITVITPITPNPPITTPISESGVESITVIIPITPNPPITTPTFESGVRIIESFAIEVADGSTLQNHEFESEPYRVFVERGQHTTITLKYTFTNRGTESATNFTVESSNLIESLTNFTDNSSGFNDFLAESTTFEYLTTCNEILHSRGESCTMEFKWSGIFQKKTPDVANSLRFDVGLSYGYDSKLIEKKLYSSSLKTQILEITLGWVSDFPMHILYDKDQIPILDEVINGAFEDNTSFRGILVLDFNKRNFNIDDEVITIRVQEQMLEQTTSGIISSIINYIADGQQITCNLDNTPCFVDVSYPIQYIIRSDDGNYLADNVPLIITTQPGNKQIMQGNIQKVKFLQSK